MDTSTLNLLTTTIVAPPSTASKWQMGFNSAFKGLIAPVPVGAVCGLSLAGIAGSNPAGDMDICDLCV